MALPQGVQNCSLVRGVRASGAVLVSGGLYDPPGSKRRFLLDLGSTVTVPPCWPET